MPMAGLKNRHNHGFTYLDDDEQHYDMVMVNDLIQRLEHLKDDGIEHISLIQANGFLESIDKTLKKIGW